MCKIFFTGLFFILWGVDQNSDPVMVLNRFGMMDIGVADECGSSLYFGRSDEVPGNVFQYCSNFTEAVSFHERLRYNKGAEVSACKGRMPDTCVFVLTPHKSFYERLGLLKNYILVCECIRKFHYFPLRTLGRTVIQNDAPRRWDFHLCVG